MLLNLFAIVFGITLLVFGGKWTIDGAANLAKKLGLPTLFIGFTIVAFGTSLPELLVSVRANLNDAPGISLGNVFGSNIANILLVIGAAAVIHPIRCQRKKSMRDTVLMLLVTMIMMILITIGVMNLAAGLLMVLLLLIYVGWQALQSSNESEDDMMDEVDNITSPGKMILYLIAGLFGVSIGAEVLVFGATNIAASLGVPDAVIGLTIVALGTSLPELVTAITAALKKQQDLIVGNIVGSNVFNILFILGVTAIIKPLNVRGLVTSADMLFLTFVTGVFAVQLLCTRKIGRTSGIIMLVIYVIYSLLQYTLK